MGWVNRAKPFSLISGLGKRNAEVELNSAIERPFSHLDLNSVVFAQ